MSASSGAPGENKARGSLASLLRGEVRTTRLAGEGFFRRSLLPLPTPRISIPNAIGEQAIQIGKVRIAVDEEIQPVEIVFARPLASRRRQRN
jgi:hypothetical protein